MREIKMTPRDGSRPEALRGVLASALVAFSAVAAHPGGQALPPWSAEESILIGAESRYEGRYGRAEFRDVDDDMARPWPRQRATRTIGRLEETRTRGLTRVVEWTNPIATHAVCGQRYCVAITPAEELAHEFSNISRTWVGRELEIIGAIDDLSKDPRRGPLRAFLVWSITLADEGTVDDEWSPTVSELEALVTSPEAQAGERISVKGVFRGSNLFGDMPPGSQREPEDWVLKDGPFFIWVTGKRPKGSGFSLDSSSRSDCRWRLEVAGKVENEDGLVYLKAREVRLLGRATEETPSP